MASRIAFFLSCIHLFVLPVHAQIEEVGLPFINNYFRDDYNAGTQNWSITQDSDDQIYFANNNGVLRFDGTSWSVYQLPNNSIVRSVNWIDNKLYAGGYEEFGYFATDESGIFTYYSLSDKLTENDRNFDEIWRIIPTEQGIVFQSFLRIFILKDDQIRVLSPKSRFGFSYYSDHNLFIIDRETGLSLLTSNGPFPIYSDPDFFKENEIAFIISKSLNEYLVGTTNNGIFLFNGVDLTPWGTEINKRLLNDQIYTGLKLSNEQIAIGTIQNGVYIIDLNGSVIMHVNRLKGLQNNTVLSMYQDRFENLWLGLDNGIDALEISSPITNLDYYYGIETSYVSIVYNGLLYIGTNQGLFAKPVSHIANRYINNEKFEKVDGIVGQVWTLEEFNGKLICGNNLGTFIVDAFGSYQISDRQGGWDYVKVPGREDILIGGTYTGLQLFSYADGTRNGWKEADNIISFNESSKEITFDENNHLWVTHEYKGIYKLQLSEDLLSVDSIHLYTQTGGLPELPYSISKINGEFYVVTNNGLYSYESKRDSFLFNEEYSLMLKDEAGLTKVKEDSRGDLWFFTNQNMGVHRKQEDGTYLKIDKPFKRIHGNYLGSSFENVFVYDQDHVFIGSERGIFHYNPNKQKEYDAHFRTIIDGVSIKGRMMDSVIYKRGLQKHTGKVPHHSNSVSFHFFAPYFESPGHISYSYKLKGFDENWSPWENRNIKDYTNLHEGDYEFTVMAKNVYGNVGQTASIKLSIAPPFYRTKMAYLVYLVIVILFATSISLVFRRRINQTRILEQARHEKEMRDQEKIYLEGEKLSRDEIERLKHERLVIEMRHKDMELANSTMYLVQKNKFLNRIRSEMQELIGKLSIESNKHALRQIVHRIDRDIKSKQHWKVFDKYFDEVHEDFLTRLKEKHPDLTPKDLRICAYLKMNISTKEIAPLMNISVRGVEIGRYRLRKKLDIDKGVNLTEYILSI